MPGGEREPGRGPGHRAKLRGPGIGRHSEWRQRQHRLPRQLRRRFQQSEPQLLSHHGAELTVDHTSRLIRNCCGCTQMPTSILRGRVALAACRGLYWWLQQHKC